MSLKTHCRKVQVPNVRRKQITEPFTAVVVVQSALKDYKTRFDNQKRPSFGTPHRRMNFNWRKRFIDMRPTELADFEFMQAIMIAGKILDDNSAPQYIRDLALAIASLGGGLRQMSVGLRATYILLEQLKMQQDRPAGRA